MIQFVAVLNTRGVHKVVTNTSSGHILLGVVVKAGMTGQCFHGKMMMECLFASLLKSLPL
jgi:hypothetical protein